MLTVNATNAEIWSEIGERGTFGKTLIEVANEMPDVVAITADLADATKVREFSKTFPDRFFQVGIAEQNMVGVAAGLALYGKTVFATSFACFSSMRVCEQVRTDVAYPKLNVKIIGSHAGYAMGTLGTTHYAIEDIGIMRSIPNMVILSPADGAEVMKATWAAAQYPGPVYLRFTGVENHPIVYTEEFDFEIGKAITLKQGKDLTIIGTGSLVAEALDAAGLLEKDGISVRVLDMHTLKPLDVEAVRKAARETGMIFTAEEHNIIGGLGSAVAEVMSEEGSTTRLVRIGAQDEFVHIATYPTLLKRCGFTSEEIYQTIKTRIK
jgi:transketolase